MILQLVRTVSGYHYLCLSLLTLLVQVIVYLLFTVYAVPSQLHFGLALVALIFTFVSVIGLLVLVHFLYLCFACPLASLSELVAMILERYCRVALLAEIVVLMMNYSVFANAVTKARGMIGFLRPYYLDPWLMALEHRYGGSLWSLLDQVVSVPLLYVCNLVYISWHFFLLITFAIVSLQQVSRYKMQFFYAFILVWFLLSFVLAVLLSSCGPCYYHLFYGVEDPLLMHYLQHVAALESGSMGSLWWQSHKIQQVLYGLYQSENWQLYTGITAMPSLHVGYAYLVYLHGCRVLGSRVVQWLLGAYVIAIWVATVVLGWHYWVDGLVAILGVHVLYHGVGRLMRLSAMQFE